jgi:uncharacterized protein (TIGR02145 family)
MSVKSFLSGSALFCILIFGYKISSAQNISITFSATSGDNSIDTVKVTNQRTTRSVTLPGDQTLALSPITGLSAIPIVADQEIIYPNPFQGNAAFISVVQESQTVYLKIQNLMGQVVSQTTVFIQPGTNEFSISVSTSGIYLVTMSTVKRTVSYKIFCTDAAGGRNAVLYHGNTSGGNGNHTELKLNGTQSGYTLGYSLGDILQYRCKSGNNITIITDSPSSSRNYSVDFAPCADPDGTHYQVVQIGDQWWMAENLAWLTEVSPVWFGSPTANYYYVYEYQGTSVAEAKKSSNYQKYGVIYNWLAAMNGAVGSKENPSGVQGACPTGWHLPSQAEWDELINFLGADAGFKMKATSGWVESSGSGNNSSGFNGLPGGLRITDQSGGFRGLGAYGYFWSASEYSGTIAFHTTLNWFTSVVQSIYADYKDVGISVRCLRD